jgi:FlaA1/EpsC-like NDP-sugar epimerase
VGGADNGAIVGRRQAISAAAARVRADIAFAGIDVFVVASAYVLGLGLRMLDPTVGSGYWASLAMALPLIILIHIGANALAGAYGHVWEYASTSEAIRLVAANASASTLIILLELGARATIGTFVPWSTLVLGGLLSFLLMGLVRYRSRLFSFRKGGDGPRILVVGSGPEAAVFARRAPEANNGGRVIGFIKTNGGGPSTEKLIADLPILGTIDDLANVVEGARVDQVVVAGEGPDLVRQVVDRCLDINVRLRILPGFQDVMSDRSAPVDVRDISVQDLLVRPQVSTDMSAVASLLRGKTVLVTGGGGSIGAELVRQVLRYEPRAVFALDRDETLLHEASLEWPGLAEVVLADVRDGHSILRLFERVEPDVVFHAAALKHVPVLEAYPEEAVLTNVVGTRNLIEAASRVGTERFVLISTDKAVDPTSVMGASKRVAELLIKTGEVRSDMCTYTAVRFGNVLGSRGSVIPTFVSQIRSGGPVTVTDREMTRYFMTVNEAVELVLQAATLATGSELFLLDMGEPVRIEALARRLIRLSGLQPDVDIKIEYTGKRPGEKLEEKLSNGPVNVTSNPKIFEVPLSHPGAYALADAVEDLELAAQAGDTDKVVTLLSGLAQGTLWADRPRIELAETEHR